jgi:hypothetical protein
MKNRHYSKMMSIVSLAIAMATLLWLVPPAALCYAQGYGYGGGGGVIEVPPQPGFTSLTNKIDSTGNVTENVLAKSSDNLCNLTINKGTKALDKTGKPLDGIIAVPMEKPPPPPTNTTVIGLTYDFGPEGATFSPPIPLTFIYDPAKVLKEGVIETNLVIAVWDKVAGKWVELTGCTVDPATHTISAPISHFTVYTILAHTRPATFTVGGLTISPSEVDSGKMVTISFVVTNTGDLGGSYTVTLKIDAVTVATQTITLAGGGTETLMFDTSQDAAGTYTVDVNGVTGTFTVRAAPPPPKPAAFTAGTLTISPKEVDIGQTVTISAVVTNTGDVTGSYTVTLKVNSVTVTSKEVTLAGGASQTVTFTTTQDVAATYTVDVNGLSGTFTVRAPVVIVPKAGVPWWVWVIVGVVVVVGGLLAYFLWWKRREAAEKEEDE